MSQAKVDRYKEEKKNRKKIMKKEKMQNALLKISGWVVCAAIVVWIGFSAVKATRNSDSSTTQETDAYTLDTTALDEYMQSLQEN